jgi:glyoxylase-like metal-dependent hydrolase (beta-lactamase superfamily II)
MDPMSDELTFWTAPHPAWTPNPEWPEDVGFVTWDSASSYTFIDPLIRDDLDSAAWDQFDAAVSASGRPVYVLLTAPWHERSARAVSDRYGASVWIHSDGRRRVEGLPELKEPPAGIEVFTPAGIEEGQVAFYIAPERALVVAEFFLGTERGLRIVPSPATKDLGAFRASLNQLRTLHIDLVLVAHGPPVLAAGHAAIRTALDAFATTA